ncbi:MAG: ribosome silencing factor [Pseudomonadota bacterium]
MIDRSPAQIDWILAALDSDKAEDIVAIDLEGKSSIADWMIIATGRSSRQVGALSDKMVERLKQQGCSSIKVEGRQTGDWILIDAGDVIIHLFKPDVRTHYGLEKMWDEAGLSPAQTTKTVGNA